MATVIQLPWGDGTHPAIEIPFTITKEDWAEYALDDGGRVRVKTTVTRLFVLLGEDEQPLRDELGNRVLAAHHTTQVTISE